MDTEKKQVGSCKPLGLWELVISIRTLFENSYVIPALRISLDTYIGVFSWFSLLEIEGKLYLVSSVKC